MQARRVLHEVQGTSDDEGEDEGEECIAAKPARDLGAPTAEISKRAVSYWPPPSLVPAEADSTKPTSSDRTTPVWSADNCFTGGEMAAHEPPVLVMADTETSVVFAHACKRKGADPQHLGDAGEKTSRCWTTGRSFSRATKRESSQSGAERACISMTRSEGAA